MPTPRVIALIALMGSCVTGATLSHAASDTPATTGSAATQPAPFADVREQAPIAGNASAGAGKATVCAACHGPQGIAIAPNFPNLAGQSATYLYLQLKQFKAGQRSDPIMSGQAANLSDADMLDLASYYASLPPKPAGAAATSSGGSNLFAAGNPARGIPACQGCHGSDAMGPKPVPSPKPQPPWASFPKLRGQSPMYITKALGDFRTGVRSGSSNARIMVGVAQGLEDKDIAELSDFLSSSGP